MRRSLFAGVAFAALLTAPALAADLRAMPTKAPAYAPVYSWTGFYAGVNAGYSFSDSDNISTSGQIAPNVATVASGARPGSVGLERNGFIGGAQIGYNWQFSKWVVGLETDIAYVDQQESVNIITTVAGLTRNNVFNQELEYLGTVRARLGYTWDRTMLYATGGLAYGGVKVSGDFSGPAPASVAQFTGSSSKTEYGYTIGAGVEHAFGNNFSMKLEYLYYDLGDTTVGVNLIPSAVPPGVGSGYDSTFKTDGHIIRAGLNYKFSGL